MSTILITDCDHPSVETEREILESAGYAVEVANCRTESDVVTAGERAVALLTQYAPITDLVMRTLPMVRVVGRYGVGLDNIDLPAARQRGIRVVNVPDYCVSEVADHALALVLTLTRGIAALDRGIHAGIWDFRLGGELRRSAEMQLGIVGIGRIGSALARRALAIGFKTVATDPVRPQIPGVLLVDLEQLLETSDVVSLHVPLDATTSHLIDAVALARMKRGAYLVNTSRGGVVDQTALVAALRRGDLAGAALDVLEREPIESHDALKDLPNVVLTPHASFYSRESLVEMKRRVATGMVEALAMPSGVGVSRS